MGIEVRAVVEQDAAKLLEIYAPYVKETAITFEYEVPSVETFADRIKQIVMRYPYLAAEQDGKIVGYAYASAFKSRAAYDWAVETTIYVQQGNRGSGVGKVLLRALEQVLEKQNIINVNACIAYTEIEDEYLTQSSVKFHQHMGYEFVGRFHQCGYKFGRWYDMVWMEKHIGTHLAPPPAIKSFREVMRENETIKINAGSSADSITNT